MSEGPRYQLRRGRMPQLVDQVVVPRPSALGTLDQVPRIAADAVAAGSVSDLVPPPVDDPELGPLAMPTVD